MPQPDRDDGADRYDVLAYAIPEDEATAEGDAITVGDDATRERRRYVEFATWVAIALAGGIAYAVADASVALTAALVGALFLARTVAVRRWFPTSFGTDYRAVEAGKGGEIVAAHEVELRKRRRVRRAILGVTVAAVLAVGILRGTYVGVAAFAAVVGLAVVAPVDGSRDEHLVPTLEAESLGRTRAERRFEGASFPDDRNADDDGDGSGSDPADLDGTDARGDGV